MRDLRVSVWLLIVLVALVSLLTWLGTSPSPVSAQGKATVQQGAKVLKLRLGQMDIPWGKSEESAGSALSGGGYKHKPLSCFKGKNKAKNCSNVEFFETITGGFQGRWISIDSGQQIKGGTGILKAVNGGLEPPSVEVWQDAPVRLGLTKIDESKGTAKVVMLFRLCKKILGKESCTPFINFGIPYPLNPVLREGEVLVLSPNPPAIPANVQAQLDAEAAPLLPQAQPQVSGIELVPGVFPSAQPCPQGQSNCIMANPNPRGRVVSAANLFGAPRPGRIHAGIDLQSPAGATNWQRGPGDPILAPADGVVKSVVPVGGRCGGIVEISHIGMPLETRFLHLVKVYVAREQQVKRGQQIGVEGNERPGVCSFGAHLHFEVYRKGGGPINPCAIPFSPSLPKRMLNGGRAC